MARVLFIQPAYAHYREGLFRLLHEKHEITFVFIRGTSNYATRTEMSSDWNVLCLNGERSRTWGWKLLRIIMKQRPDVIVTSIPGSVQTLLSVIAGKCLGIPVVVWSLSWGAPYRDQNAPWWKQRIRKLRSGWGLRRADAIVAGGTRAYKYSAQRGVPEGKIYTAFQSTKDMARETPNLEPQNQKDTANTKVRLLYFSRIVRYKGLDVLIKAFEQIQRECSDVELVVCGDGPFRTECEELSNDLNLGKVHFLGAIDNANAYEHYRNADVFVLPCSGKEKGEAWGLAINEACSMGLPIVTTEAVGAVGDLVLDKINGYVVAPGSVSELAEALSALLTAPGKRRYMGSQSRLLFEKINNYEQMASGFHEAISHVLERK